MSSTKDDFDRVMGNGEPVAKRYQVMWITNGGDVAVEERDHPPTEVEVRRWIQKGRGPEKASESMLIESVHVYPFKQHAYLFVDEMGAVGRTPRPTNWIATLLYQQASLWSGDRDAALNISSIHGPAVLVVGMGREEGLS